MTPTRWKGIGEQRGKWSDGGSLGGGKFGRSKDSGKHSLVRKQGLVLSASLKSSVDLDPELKDDGTSPARKNGSITREGECTPRALQFPDGGALGEGRPWENNQDGDGVPVKQSQVQLTEHV